LYERGADFDDHVFDWFFSRGSAEGAVEGSSLAGVAWVVKLHGEFCARGDVERAVDGEVSLMSRIRANVWIGAEMVQ
jgi:hypothetical protein